MVKWRNFIIAVESEFYEGFVRDGVPGMVIKVCSKGLWWECPGGGGCQWNNSITVHVSGTCIIGQCRAAANLLAPFLATCRALTATFVSNNQFTLLFFRAPLFPFVDSA